MKLLAVLLAVVAVASATQVINGRAAGTLCTLCVNFVTDVEAAVKQDVPDIEKVSVFPTVLHAEVCPPTHPL